MADAIVLNPETPLATAKLIIHQYKGYRYWNGRFYQQGKGGWTEVEEEAVRQMVYRFCEGKVMNIMRDTGWNVERPFAPNKQRVDEIIDAMRAELFLAKTEELPTVVSN